MEDVFDSQAASNEPFLKHIAILLQLEIIHHYVCRL